MWGDGGIGRRVGLRNQYGNMWRFESFSPYHLIFMKVTVENKKGLNKDIKVFIDKKTMSAHMEKKYEEIKGQ